MRKPCTMLHRPSCGMCAQDAHLVHEWALRINAAVRELAQRPRNLLVFLNPFSGARKARRVWQRKAAPILSTAGACTRLPSAVCAESLPL